MNGTRPPNNDHDRSRDTNTPRIAIGAGLGLVADRGR